MSLNRENATEASSNEIHVEASCSRGPSIVPAIVNMNMSRPWLSEPASMSRAPRTRTPTLVSAETNTVVAPSSVSFIMWRIRNSWKWPYAVLIRSRTQDSPSVTRMSRTPRSASIQPFDRSPSMRRMSSNERFIEFRIATMISAGIEAPTVASTASETLAEAMTPAVMRTSTASNVAPRKRSSKAFRTTSRPRSRLRRSPV